MDRSREFGEFLRSRRARLRPADLGLPLDGRPRRVPGLRREEIAQLAGVSTDYYTRLEQGRGGNVSESVLDAVARALNLDETERAHLFDLGHPPRTRRRAPARPQRVRPGLYRLLDSLQTPAFILGRRLDVLATNALARALLTDFDALPAAERNFVRFMLLDPASRELCRDWEKIAAETVASLRLDSGRHPGDRQLSDLVGELSTTCPEFPRWWACHQVAERTHGTKRYRHPVVGDLTVDYEALRAPDDPDQTLYVYTVEPGSPSEEALRLLTSWVAEMPPPRLPTLPTPPTPPHPGPAPR